MSSAFYPQGMNSWNNRLPQGGYKSWKGKGVYSNPVGVTATHIRPLTNNDPGNVFPTGFGLPRPLKHYRKGTVIPVQVPILTEDPNNPGKYVEQSLIEYNVNRSVKSSIGSSLGGGNGGTGLISQLNDMPGSFIVKNNDPLNNFNKIENVTPYRYLDWMVTTPTMLITLAAYLDNKSYTSINEYLTVNKEFTIKVVVLNLLMLLFMQ